MNGKAITAGVKTNRIEFVDIARGIAMLSIILGHLGRPEINRVVFTYDLPIFFLISGYFFDTKSTVTGFLKKKLRTLIVPYFLCSAIITILSIPRAAVRNENVGASVLHWAWAALYGAGDSWEVPFHIEAIGALWFLWAMFWALLVFKLLVNQKAWVRMTCVLLYFAVGTATWTKGWMPLSIQAGGPAILYVYMGYLIRQFLNRNKDFCRNYREPAVLLLIGLAAVWIYMIQHFAGFWLVHCQIGNGIVDILGSLGGCLVLLLLSKVIDRNVPVLNTTLGYYGRYSILLLCVHNTELTLNPWHRVMSWMPSSLISSDGKYLAVLIAAKIVFDCLVTFGLSKIRIVRKLFGIKD